MTKCHICGRAMVTETHLPLDICKRASCEPERRYLNKQWGGILSDFDWIAQAARVADSGINQV